jgi:ribosome-associated protein
VVLLIDSRVHRTQPQNRQAARERLVELIRKALVRPKPRRKTRPTRAAKEKRIDTKKRRSQVKSLRRSSGED